MQALETIADSALAIERTAKFMARIAGFVAASPSMKADCELFSCRCRPAILRGVTMVTTMVTK